MHLSCHPCKCRETPLYCIGLWIQFSSRTAKPLAVSPHLLGAECPGTRSTRVDTRLCLLQWSALCIARKVETCGVATVCSNPVAAHSYMYLVEMAAFLRDEFQVITCKISRALKRERWSKKAVKKPNSVMQIYGLHMYNVYNRRLSNRQ